MLCAQSHRNGTAPRSAGEPTILDHNRLLGPPEQHSRRQSHSPTPSHKPHGGDKPQLGYGTSATQGPDMLSLRKRMQLYFHGFIPLKVA